MDTLIESKYPETLEALNTLQKMQLELFYKKLSDYGPGNISLGTRLENEEDINFALLAIAFRMNDKVQRLMNLLKRNTNPQNEPIIDTLDDLATYALIARIVMAGNWGK